MKITHLENQLKSMFAKDITARKIRYYIENEFLPPLEALNQEDASEIYKYLLNIIWLLKEDGMSFEQIKNRIKELAEYKPNPYEPMWPNGSMFFQEEYDPELHQVHTLDACRREYLKLYKRIIAERINYSRLEVETLDALVDGLNPAVVGMLMDNRLIEPQSADPRKRPPIVRKLDDTLPIVAAPQTYDKNDLYLIESLKAYQTTSPIGTYRTIQVLEKLNRLTDEILDLTHTSSNWPVYHILHGMLYNKARQRFQEASKHFKEFYEEEVSWEFGEISIPGIINYSDYEASYLYDVGASKETDNYEELEQLNIAENLRFQWIDHNAKLQFINRYRYWIEQFDQLYPEDTILDPNTQETKCSTEEIYKRLRHMNTWRLIR